MNTTNNTSFISGNERYSVHLSKFALLKEQRWVLGPIGLEIWASQYTIDFITEHGSDFWVELRIDRHGGSDGFSPSWHIILPDMNIEKLNK